MPGKHEQFDLQPAVTAWKTLWIEARESQERFDLVWAPTQQLLDTLTVNPPSAFTYFTGDEYMFPKDTDGAVLDVYFVGPDNQIAYFGTLCNRTANNIDREMEIERLSKINGALAEKLAKADPLTIVRDAYFCKIPINQEEFTVTTVNGAIKRYLSVRAPALAQLPLDRMPYEKGIKLIRRIREKARSFARPTTDEDRSRARLSDELELL